MPMVLVSEPELGLGLGQVLGLPRGFPVHSTQVAVVSGPGPGPGLGLVCPAQPVEACLGLSMVWVQRRHLGAVGAQHRLGSGLALDWAGPVRLAQAVPQVQPCPPV